MEKAPPPTGRSFSIDNPLRKASNRASASILQGGNYGKVASERISSTPADNTIPLELLNCQQVVTLLKNSRLGKYSKMITENEVDGATLQFTETLEEVKELELDDLKFKPVTHAKKLLMLIARWKEEGVDPRVFR